MVEARDLSQRFCARPFINLEINDRAQGTVCCPAWTDVPLGTVDPGNIEAVWNGPAIQEMRASILDGSFRHCDQTRCPYILDDYLPKRDDITEPRLRAIIDHHLTVMPHRPLTIGLAHERSCNLACPSCRTHKFVETDKAIIDRELARLDQILKMSPDCERLTVTGSGDPFGSIIFRRFLRHLDVAAYPKLRISLLTNGVLLTPKMWRLFAHLHDRIDRLIISLDAASEATYNRVRRGGNWSVLMRNLAHLATQVPQHKNIVRYQFAFVVQHLNYREMPAYISLAELFGAEPTFQKITDWGTFSADEFKRHCIWSPEHPEYPDFIATFADPRFDHPGVHLDNCRPFYEMCRATSGSPTPTNR